VSEPGEKHTDSKGAARAGQLPNPELNPIMNPVLGQNLGRWAQVYFINPPEKREQAVTALLRELERQNPEASVPHKFGAEEPAHQDRVRHEIVCSGCGHRSKVTQRFCGACGAFLKANLAATVQNDGKNRGADRTPAHTWPVTADNAVREVRVRDKAHEGADESNRRTYRPGKFRISRFGIAGFAILFVGFAYLQWISTPGVSSNAHLPPEPVPRSAFPMRAPQVTPHPESRRPDGVVAPNQAIAPVAFLPASATEKTAAGSGTEELRTAQRYLRGNGPARDSTAAAQWLWKAVAMHNSNALLLLADLYLRGDGVPKSCDQARLLLAAAAEKGVPEADQKLSGLDLSGCR